MHNQKFYIPTFFKCLMYCNLGSISICAVYSIKSNEYLKYFMNYIENIIIKGKRQDILYRESMSS